MLGRPDARLSAVGRRSAGLDRRAIQVWAWSAHVVDSRRVRCLPSVIRRGCVMTACLGGLDGASRDIRPQSDPRRHSARLESRHPARAGETAPRARSYVRDSLCRPAARQSAVDRRSAGLNSLCWTAARLTAPRSTEARQTDALRQMRPAPTSSDQLRPAPTQLRPARTVFLRVGALFHPPARQTDVAAPTWRSFSPMTRTCGRISPPCLVLRGYTTSGGES